MSVERIRCDSPGGCGRWVIKIDRKNRMVIDKSPVSTAWHVLNDGKWSGHLDALGSAKLKAPIRCDAVEVRCRCGRYVSHHFPPLGWSPV